MGNVQTLASDLFPIESVGSVAGLSGSAAGLGAMLLTAVTGFVVDHGSYTPILITGACLAPIATYCLFALCGPLRAIETHAHDAP